MIRSTKELLAEEKTDPGADAQGIEATASGIKLAVGARVKVLPSADTGGPTLELRGAQRPA